MGIPFTKYHGTGNDFIIIDDREETFDVKNTTLINQMCNRRFGIGADGLILLRNVEGFDFQMVYFNSDGNQSSMCGNGGRCIVHFAHGLEVFGSRCSFLAIDGPHEAYVFEDNIVKLKMGNVDKISRDGEAFVLDTGSPHYVLKVDNIGNINIKEEGATIRYSEKYAKEGINVNFLECGEKNTKVATYERGVEDETYSCGTGVTAAVLTAFTLDSKQYSSPITVFTRGGELSVHFAANQGNSYTDIWLEGPAIKTYEGKWENSE